MAELIQALAWTFESYWPHQLKNTSSILRLFCAIGRRLSFDGDQRKHRAKPQRITLIEQLLQVKRLITPVLVELRAPHFVYALVLRTTEAHGRPEPNV